MFQQTYGGDVLEPVLLKIISRQSLAPVGARDCNKLVSALEVFMVLLKEANQFVQDSKNVKNCVTLVSKVAFEHAVNPAVTLPILGALLTLRDLNLASTMAQLAKLDANHFRVVEQLAKQHAPDLDLNIRQHVIQRILFGVDPSDESSQKSSVHEPKPGQVRLEVDPRQ